jgi:hypothetical protein
MAEFDIPGLPQLRMELKTMAVSRTQRRTSPVLEPLVKELYAEIRDCRIAGVSWKALSEVIKRHTKVTGSPPSLKKVFEQVDKEWERETGVAALDTQPRKKRGRPKNVQQMDKTA